MGGVLAGLTTLAQAVATAFGGAMGVSLATIGLAGTALGCLLFHLPFHFMWKAVIIVAVMLGAGAVAQALVGQAGTMG